MAQVEEITVKDAGGVTREVPTFKTVADRLLGGAVTEAATLTITTGGTAQTPLDANSVRKCFGFCNTSHAAGGDGWDMYVRFGATAANGVGLLVPPGGSILMSEGSTPLDAISVWCSQTGATFYAFEI